MKYAKSLPLVLFFVFSGCLLKTRTEMGETDQSAVYSQKNAQNQLEAQKAKGIVAENPAALVDERDELIRNLNGRMEVMENNYNQLSKDREAERIQYEQKLATLQEALTKMEKQLQDESADAGTSNVSGPNTGKTDTTKSDGTSKNTKEPYLQSSDEIEARIAADKAGHKKDKKTDEKSVETKKAGKSEAKPQSPYEVAQEFFDNKEWKKAILNYHKYTDESPKGKLVPDAKYKIGVCFQELGMKEEAMAYYEEVVANYQSTEAGKKSKYRLGQLKK